MSQLILIPCFNVINKILFQLINKFVSHLINFFDCQRASTARRDLVRLLSNRFSRELGLSHLVNGIIDFVTFLRLSVVFGMQPPLI